MLFRQFQLIGKEVCLHCLSRDIDGQPRGFLLSQHLRNS